MNKGEFISYIADRCHCTKAESEKIIDIFTDSVIAALSEGEKVALVNFGTFGVVHLAEREGRNPSTGGALTIAAHNQPRFKAGKKLKEACN